MVRSALSTRALTGLRRLWAINASPCALAATSSGGATSQALMQPPCSSRTTLPVPLHYQALHGIHTTGSSGQGATSVSDLPGGRRIELEIGRLAPLADGSCVARMGDTHVLATVVCSSEVDPEVDGMPLQVDFAEGAHTMARIPISGTRREPRPGGSDKEVLGARAIDRALRPLFLPGFLYEIHVCATVLSIERHVPHADVLAINAASAALLCSDIPWGGPVGAVRVGLDSDGHPVLFPTQQQIVDGGMNLMYAGTSDKAMMVELQANQISEELLVQAMEMAQGAVETIVLSQQRQAKAVGRKKRVATLYNLPQHLEDKVESLLAPKLEELLRQQRLLKSSHESGQGPDSSKHERSAAIQRVKGIGASQLKKEGLWATEDKPDGLSDGSYSLAFDSALSGVMRKMALEEGVRIDGRGLTDVRSLACEVSPLPPRSVHGSALFQRGDTQVLSVATVGNQEDVLEERKGAADFKPQHFFLHYRFPPFSVNEVGKLGAPNRREIGHGALAEKALAPLMPLVDQFPFPVRLFVDTLASNGSSSMAAVCAGSLAMRCAGVPTSDQAAGISMGLLTEWGGKQSGYKMKAGGTNPGEPCWSWPSSYGRHKLITDVQGAEDQLGDMDFKVAGTRKGITALQLDIKLPGVPIQVLADALHPARVARLKILDLMESEFQSKVASLPAEDRPGFEILPINKDYMRLVVGPHGETLAEIQDSTNTRLVVPEVPDTDDCNVHVYAPNSASMNAAKSRMAEIEGTDMVEGKIYRAKVVAVQDIGALLEMDNGTRHYLHLGEVAHTKVRDLRDLLKEGQELDVKYLGRDTSGLAVLSRKAAQAPPPKTTPKHHHAGHAANSPPGQTQKQKH